MAEILSYDPSSDPEVLASIESDEAESLAIGEEMINQANERLAGKYKNAQELEKAYMELEKKLGSKETTEEPQAQQDEKTEDDKPEDATVDFLWEVNEEYEKNNGKLSEETLEKFNSMSSKELVEAFFRYQDTLEQTEAPQAVELSEAQVNQIQNLVGGAQKYQQLVSWAAENFSPEEVEAFDGVVESGNVGAIKLALQALQYRYQDNMGYEGDMIQGRAAKARDAFKSQAEVVRAMNDPRYDRDPAYRNEIMEKLARSDIKF
jgi:hypothetical protein